MGDRTTDSSHDVAPQTTTGYMRTLPSLPAFWLIILQPTDAKEFKGIKI
jgi:hypothetical protein